MLDDFEASAIDVRQTTIFFRQSGEGPPLLLLHGFPQTHLMWHAVAPLLSRRSIWKDWCRHVTGQSLNAGHFFPEEKPQETASLLIEFLERPPEPEN